MVYRLEFKNQGLSTHNHELLIERGCGEMMDYYGNMMGWGGFGLLVPLFFLVVFADLVLLGVWLWKNIQKK